MKKIFKSIRSFFQKQINILIIPSTNYKMINISLSFAFIFLIATMFGLLLFIAFYKVGNFKSVFNGVSLWESNHKESQKYEYYQSHIDSVEELQDNFDEVLNSLKEVYVVADGKKGDLDNLTHSEEIKLISAQKIEEIKKQDSNSLQDPIAEQYYKDVEQYLYLKNLMSSQQKLLSSLENLILKKYQILSSIPFGKPMRSYTLTSKFGPRNSPTSIGYREFHAGIDLAHFSGVPIYATADGVVQKVAYSLRGYGYHIVIRHANGFHTLYAHCRNIYVKKNQKIRKGALIAAVGATGNVTGPHLHYEIWMGSNRINPLEYINVSAYN